MTGKILLNSACHHRHQREDRSPAKKSNNNLARIRKFVYNILRIAILSGDCAKIMTEAMGDFSDEPF